MTRYLDELYDRLRDEGQDPYVLSHPTGGRLLIARHGARLLAVDDPAMGLEENPLFTASGGDGKLTGGDRLWVAPEVAWFWPSLEDARRDPKGTAAVPSTIDPGQYVRRPSDDHGVLLTGGAEGLTDTRSGRRVQVSIERNFWLTQPLEGLPEGVACVSFGIRNTLGRAHLQPDAVAGGWDILMVPPTGTLICPTAADLTRTGGPTSYYEPFGRRHVSVESNRVRFLIDGTRRVKMGLPPEATTGRMGYLRGLGGGRSSLILRFFPTLPGEPYCDLPRDAEEGRRLGGDCLQAYNDDGDAFAGDGVTFGEMEYHDPCLIGGRPPQSRSGTCTTHVLVGPTNAVQAVGAGLLGAAVDNLA